MIAVYWIVLVAVIALSAWFIGWLIFRTWDDFLDSLWFGLIPDIISLFKGELKRDWTAEMKLSLFVVASLIVAAFEKKLLDALMHYLQ